MQNKLKSNNLSAEAEMETRVKTSLLESQSSLEEAIEKVKKAIGELEPGRALKEAKERILDLETQLRELKTQQMIVGDNKMSNGEVRFIVKSDDFEPIDANFTEAEIQDTKKLLEEARRRLKLFAQVKDDDLREVIQQAIMYEADELWLTITAVAAVIPLEIMPLIEDMRASFGILEPFELSSSNTRRKWSKKRRGE